MMVHSHSGQFDGGPFSERDDRQQAPEEVVAADIVVVADFSSADAVWRIESEIRAQAELGYRSVLVHVRTGNNYIHPDINACVSEGLALPVEATGKAVRARLALLYDADKLFRNLLAGQVLPLPRILTDFVVALGFEGEALPDSADEKQADILIRSVFGTTTVWAAETASVQSRLRERGLHVLDELWRPSVPTGHFKPVATTIRRNAPVVGCAGTGAAAWWRADAAEMAAAFGPPGERFSRILLPGAEGDSDSPFPNDWGVVYSRDMSLRSYLAGLDAFVFCPSDEDAVPPFVVIAAALSCGLPTVLHPRYRGLFGDEAIYALPAESAAVVLREFQASDTARRQQAEMRSSKSAKARGSQVHALRIGALIGSAAGSPAPRRKEQRRRVLFLSTDVIGLGHLTRQLAIARRCPSHVEPIFATSSLGFDVVRKAGFRVEYLPYQDQASFDVAAWNGWLATQLGLTMDAYSIDGIVFDGAVPHEGLLKAMQERRQLASIWIRRSMWRQHHDTHALGRQRYFELTIEPGEIASANDKGATPSFRCGTLTVPPIMLLDKEEVLDRATAAARLGLQPDRPAVLIQLGAEITRNVAAVVDRILNLLEGRPEIQLVLADWNISSSLDLSPKIKRLRGFPFSRYFAAFDFSISAAGYNTFNEIISLGLPTIFLSNTNAATDDQPGRAEFAEANGAAIALSEHDIGGLQLGIESLLQERARAYLRANCQKLAQSNGAAAAAEVIATMVA